MTRQPSPPGDDTMIAVVQRYGPALSSYFARRVSDRAEVEDLTQEVFAALIRRADIESIENVEGYLFRIAGNLLRYRARLASRRPDVRPEGGPDPMGRLVEDISPERVILGQEAWAVFVQALQELPERARTIFILNRFEELSGREIAQRLGYSISLVEKEMIKAISYLRERLP